MSQRSWKMEMKLSCPITAFGGNEAKLATEHGLSKDCFRIAEETVKYARGDEIMWIYGQHWQKL